MECMYLPIWGIRVISFFFAYKKSYENNDLFI